MSTKKDTTIIFQEGRISKILKTNRKTLKQFFTTLSLLVSALIISMILTIIFYQSQIAKVKSSQFSNLSSLENSNAEKATIIETLTKENVALREKLAQPAEETSALSLFTLPKGFKDISKQSLINLEEIKTSALDGKASIKFNVMNAKQSGKISGYTFVSLYTGSGIIVTPSSKSLEAGTPIEFYQGESFTVSRFRPFEADFNIPRNLKQAMFRVVIFSKTGDLVTNKTVGPVDLTGISQ